MRMGGCHAAGPSAGRRRALFCAPSRRLSPAGSASCVSLSLVAACVQSLLLLLLSPCRRAPSPARFTLPCCPAPARLDGADVGEAQTPGACPAAAALSVWALCYTEMRLGWPQTGQVHAHCAVHISATSHAEQLLAASRHRESPRAQPQRGRGRPCMAKKENRASSRRARKAGKRAEQRVHTHTAHDHPPGRYAARIWTATPCEEQEPPPAD